MKYILEDEALMIEGLSRYNAQYIWKEFVETRGNYEIRIYWRNLFFDTMKNFLPSDKLFLPNGKYFVIMVEEWINKQHGGQDGNI